MREGKAWLVDDEAYDQKLADLGITDLGEIIGMWAERTWHDIKMWFRQLVRDFFELLFNAAGLTIDTLRTFFLVVLSILGPLSFALSVYDGFQSTLAPLDIALYQRVSVAAYRRPVFGGFGKIQALMLERISRHCRTLPTSRRRGRESTSYFFTSASIGYFTIPTVAEWVIQSGGASGAMGGINKAGTFGAGVAGGFAGNTLGRVSHTSGHGAKAATQGRNMAVRNDN